MTEKTLKHELYKHGSYLISLKESGSSFVNIDDEIEKNEELFQLASKKDHQPTFVVGEYYSFTTYRKDYDADTNFIFKVLEIKNCGIKVCEYDCHGKNYEEYVYDSDSEFLKGSKPATDEQIKEFKLAEAIAKTGQSADQIRQMLSNGKMPMGPWLELQKTAEELQEVENNG